MGAMKEAFMDFMSQIEEAEANDDQIIVNTLHAIMGLKTVVSRLNVAREHYTENNKAMREAFTHLIKTIESDIEFLEKLVSILNEEEGKAA